MGDAPGRERVLSAQLRKIKSFSEDGETEELNNIHGDPVIQTEKIPSKLQKLPPLAKPERSTNPNTKRFPPTSGTGCPTSKAKYQKKRQVMAADRARAAAYREQTFGRRNAFNIGRKTEGTRCVSMMEKSNVNDSDQKDRSKSSMAELSGESEIDRIYSARMKSTGLTKKQIKAFREVFDIFDSNGGGTIDSGELKETLQSVGIVLSREEIDGVLGVIDEDGSGEIDFEEFLQLMTNTERFLEAITKRRESRAQESRQGTLLFDALTEFMKKSALHSMDEIVDYYSHKYKKAQTPHVVNHYAAGARLIGLTDRQLKEHLENLKASHADTNNEFQKNSPYAMPLHIITSSSKLPVIQRNKPKQRGRIKLIVKLNPRKSSSGTIQITPIAQTEGVSQKSLVWDTKGKLHRLPVSYRGFGWVSQHTDHIDVQLQSEPLRKLLPFHALTAEDLPSIRTNVEAATLSYKKGRCRAQLMDNFKHWHALEARLISPQSLQEHFRGTFSIYTLVAKQHLIIN